MSMSARPRVPARTGQGPVDHPAGDLVLVRREDFAPVEGLQQQVPARDAAHEAGRAVRQFDPVADLDGALEPPERPRPIDGRARLGFDDPMKVFTNSNV